MSNEAKPFFTSEELLENWQGHRRLTRRVIEAFPEKELFEFSVGGMRPFAEMVKEFLAIAVPGLTQIVNDADVKFDEHLSELKTKQDLLNAWDKQTDEINELWQKIKPERFHEEVNLFGEYKFPAIQNIQYFIDNEIHHRGQGFVYLRVLGIEPPFFWER
ncbi:MAG: DinB family protein [Moheibacter sp.]